MTSEIVMKILDEVFTINLMQLLNWSIKIIWESDWSEVQGVFWVITRERTNKILNYV